MTLVLLSKYALLETHTILTPSRRAVVAWVGPASLSLLCVYAKMVPKRPLRVHCLYPDVGVFSDLRDTYDTLLGV